VFELIHDVGAFFRYLDDDLRIFRNEEDDQVFVYIKA